MLCGFAWSTFTFKVKVDQANPQSIWIDFFGA